MPLTKRHVILDVDPGTDDIYALLLLLHAEKLGTVKIEAIVCTRGNASLEYVSKNLIRVLEILNRTDIPVYKGVVDAIIPSKEPIPQFHGEDGFGDLEYETEPDVSIIRKEPASAAMRNIVINNPGQITLICLGPLTNAALTMKLYDDFAPNIKEIFIMGGNYAATGNLTDTAEYNFWVDPESAFIVLDNAKCLVTVAPWETCTDTYITLDWRFDVLGLKQSPFMELLNRAEKSIYSHTSTKFWYVSDAFLVMAMLYPKETIIRQIKCNATVELHGNQTRGQVVLAHKTKKEPNIIMLKKINDEFAKEILLKVVDETL